MKERRRFQRVTLNVLISSNNETKATVKNISESGICITTKVPLACGRFIKLLFALPDGMEMQVNGKVAWSILTDNSLYENGIDFLPIRTCYKERLTRFLN